MSHSDFPGDFPGIDLNSSATRQQRITDMMMAVLPGIDARKRKQTAMHASLIVMALALFFMGGYSIGDYFRPLTYSEKMIVQALIEHTAMQQNKSPQEITRNLLTHLGAYKVKDIKSHQLADALAMLGQYID